MKKNQIQWIQPEKMTKEQKIYCCKHESTAELFQVAYDLGWYECQKNLNKLYLTKK